MKHTLSITTIIIAFLATNCDVVKSDESSFETITLETNKFLQSDFSINMSELFHDYELKEMEGLNEYTLREEGGEDFLIYNDNIESFGMLLAKNGENVIAQVNQNFIDPSSCSATDNFTSATISNDETIFVDLLATNVDLCGVSDHNIAWMKAQTPEDDGNYETYLLSIITDGNTPGSASATIEFVPLDDFTGTVELSYLISLGTAGTPDIPAGRTWSSIHNLTITVTD